MRVLLKILLWIVGIAALLAVVGFFLPRNVRVVRNTSINANPTTVYNIVNDLKTYDNWMPWNKIDPAMKKEFGPSTTGEGAWYTWKSENKNVGEGKITITESVPGKLVRTRLDFKGFDNPGLSGWELTEKNGGTDVKWFMDSDMGDNPFGHIIGLFMDKMMGSDFEKGLTDLKKLAETAPATAKEPVIKIEETQVKPMTVLYTIEKAATSDEIGQKLGAAYGEMGAFMKKNNLQMAGAPAATYKSQQAPFDFEAWASVNAAPKKVEGRIKFKKIEGGKAVVAHFFGPYEMNYKGFEKLMSYIKEKGLTPVGSSYEVYVNDPTTVKDPYEIQTDIYQVVK